MHVSDFVTLFTNVWYHGALWLIFHEIMELTHLVRPFVRISKWVLYHETYSVWSPLYHQLAVDVSLSWICFGGYSSIEAYMFKIPELQISETRLEYIFYYAHIEELNIYWYSWLQILSIHFLVTRAYIYAIAYFIFGYYQLKNYSSFISNGLFRCACIISYFKALSF